MSLVEKALRKMESTRAMAAPAAAVVRLSNDTVPEVPRAAATPAQQRESQVPVRHSDKVIAVNYPALRSAGLLPPEDEERRVGAEYRQIKRPLMAAARGRGMPALPNGRVIMVASALPGEGKTFTSLNLSLSMALEKDTTVLLVDGDFAKAHVSRAFGVRDEPGLMDVLLDESREVASAVIPTTVRGVSILPAGRGADTATELLASARMERLIADLLSGDPSRIIVFDSPPLLLTTESRALTSIAGQIVVVVRAEETAHKAVLDALKYVGEGKPVGLILNQCRSSPSHSYYGYGEYGDSSDGRSDRQ